MGSTTRYSRVHRTTGLLSVTRYYQQQPILECFNLRIMDKIPQIVRLWGDFTLKGELYRLRITKGYHVLSVLCTPQYRSGSPIEEIRKRVGAFMFWGSIQVTQSQCDSSESAWSKAPIFYGTDRSCCSRSGSCVLSVSWRVCVRVSVCSGGA